MTRAGKDVKGTADELDLPSGDLPNSLDDLKRLKAEEAKKKREEYMKERLNAIVAEEQKYSKFNQYKIKNNWLKLLRQSKVDELKQEIEIAAQEHDRQVDRRDAIIQMLYQDLEEAEEQYRLALRTHLRHVDELLDLQSRRMQMLHEEFNNELYLLKQEFEEEKKEIQESHEEEKLECLEIQMEMEKRANRLDQEMKEEHNRLKEAIKGQYSEDFTMMEGRMKGIIERYKSISRVDNRNFVETMQATHSKYILLNKQDDEQTEKIKAKTLKIKVLEENLAHWKAKWLNNLREYEERNKQLTYEKEQLALHFKELKKKMTRFRESEKKRLAEMVKAAKQANDSLQQKLEKANRILQLAELCRKYETEREKILPFESDMDLTYPNQEQTNNEEDVANQEEQDEDQLMEQLQQEFRDEDETLSQSDWDLLSRFYKKFNKVLLDKVALTQEKEHLVEQNQKLRQMLKSYLDGISVNEDVLARKNPLLMIEPLDNSRRQTRGATEEVITVKTNNNMNKIAIRQ